MNDFIPHSITGFTEYIKIAYVKASTNLAVYGINPIKLQALAPDYEAYVAAEAVAANPDTATKGARRERDEARGILEPKWRQFLNENIRFNSLVSPADLEVFGIRERDTVLTPAQVPANTATVTVTRLGAFEYEVIVIDQATSKRKLPEHATGSYLYLAVSEVGTTPEALETYRKMDFSSNARHLLQFPSEELTKQGNVYVRYSNAHGKEGPIGPIESFIIT
jgi:hypothetical protein